MPLSRVRELSRFPVKSMRGEVLTVAQVEATGFVGDRAYAVIDLETGKVGSAKDPRRWSSLLGFRASYSDDAAPGARLSIELPSGEVVASDGPDVDERLSSALGRLVRLESAPTSEAVFDDVWPDIEDLAPAEVIASTQTAVTEDGLAVSTFPVGGLAPGTYQDFAPITLMTTSSLAAMAAICPSSHWDPRRFRSNILLESDGTGFIENEWSGRELAVGDVRLKVLTPTPRCVMTTLPQEDLAGDRDVLREVARHNRVEVGGGDTGVPLGRYACLGVYAVVTQPGSIAVGDMVTEV